MIKAGDSSNLAKEWVKHSPILGSSWRSRDGAAVDDPTLLFRSRVRTTMCTFLYFAPTTPYMFPLVTTHTWPVYPSGFHAT